MCFFFICLLCFRLFGDTDLAIVYGQRGLPLLLPGPECNRAEYVEWEFKGSGTDSITTAVLQYYTSSGVPEYFDKYKGRITLDFNTQSLVLNQLEAGDQGNYTVKCDTEVQKIITLHIFEPVKQPTILSREGQKTLNLTCHEECGAVIQWSNDSGIIKSETGNKLELLIAGDRRKICGTYTCVVINHESNASANISVLTFRYFWLDSGSLCLTSAAFYTEVIMYLIGSMLVHRCPPRLNRAIPFSTATGSLSLVCAVIGCSLSVWVNARWWSAIDGTFSVLSVTVLFGLGCVRLLLIYKRPDKDENSSSILCRGLWFLLNVMNSFGVIIVTGVQIGFSVTNIVQCGMRGSSFLWEMVVGFIPSLFILALWLWVTLRKSGEDVKPEGKEMTLLPQKN